VRHRTLLIERCAICYIEDPLLPVANASSATSCWKCGYTLLSYDRDEQTSPVVAEIIDLEHAILAVISGYPPDQRWAKRFSAKRFIQKLRILIGDLTKPTDGPMPSFFRMPDADPQLRRYLLGRQRPETQIETLS
jgi:hypothetical protein